MNLILRMMRGPQAGSRRILQTGQRALVGATQWCDFPADDNSLGDPHFLIKCDQTACWVENVTDDAQLRVNGVFVDHKRLADGDVVTAGECDFMASIRGRAITAQRLDVPLVGTHQFTEQFRRSVVSFEDQVSDNGFARSTMGPAQWSEATWMSNSGTGTPSMELLEKASRFRPAGLILESSAMAEFMKPGSTLTDADFIRLSAVKDRKPLVLLEGQSVSDIHSLLQRSWSSGQIMFYVPRDETANHRKKFHKSILWINKSIRKISTLLIDGPDVRRESVFRYLDTIILPRADGWLLLSRPGDQTADISFG